MTTLAEFLTARLDEDEAVSRSLDAMDPPAGRREDRQRIAREVAAKQTILEAHAPSRRWPTSDETCLACVDFHADVDCENKPFPCPTVRALASVYADHPDYREEWA